MCIRDRPYIAKIKALEPALMALSHDQLRAKTAEFKEKIKLARAKQDAEIAAKKADAENTSDIDLSCLLYTSKVSYGKQSLEAAPFPRRGLFFYCWL